MIGDKTVRSLFLKLFLFAAILICGTAGLIVAYKYADWRSSVVASEALYEYHDKLGRLRGTERQKEAEKWEQFRLYGISKDPWVRANYLGVLRTVGRTDFRGRSDVILELVKMTEDVAPDNRRVAINSLQSIVGVVGVDNMIEQDIKVIRNRVAELYHYTDYPTRTALPALDALFADL